MELVSDILFFTDQSWDKTNIKITNLLECVAQIDKMPKNNDIFFLDLPVEVILTIFSYMDDAGLFFNVRCVCHRLKDIIEDCIEIGKQL